MVFADINWVDLFRIISAHFLENETWIEFIFISCYFEFKSTLNYALHLILINRLLCSSRHALISTEFEFCRMQTNVSFALKWKQKKHIVDCTYFIFSWTQCCHDVYFINLCYDINLTDYKRISLSNWCNFWQMQMLQKKRG